MNIVDNFDTGIGADWDNSDNAFAWRPATQDIIGSVYGKIMPRTDSAGGLNNQRCKVRQSGQAALNMNGPMIMINTQKDRGYFIQIFYNWTRARICRMTGGSAVNLTSLFTFTYAPYNDFEIEKVGDNIYARVDGVLKATVQDATYNSGMVGLYGGQNDGQNLHPIYDNFDAFVDTVVVPVRRIYIRQRVIT